MSLNENHRFYIQQQKQAPPSERQTLSRNQPNPPRNRSFENLDKITPPPILNKENSASWNRKKTTTPLREPKRSLAALPQHHEAASEPEPKSSPSLKAVEHLPEVIIYSYAWLSRKGFSPGRPEKKNQDSVLIKKKLCGIENAWMFGVCDGHGVLGHIVSAYVKKTLPQNIEHMDKRSKRIP